MACGAIAAGRQAPFLTSRPFRRFTGEKTTIWIQEIGMRNRYKEIMNCHFLKYLLPDHRCRRQIEIEADEQLVGFPERF